ncbi:MAG: 16S rRNA (cytidine(1402)-2'-O)-methyltransferase, partial [Verrucomicrobiota bacterium]
MILEEVIDLEPGVYLIATPIGNLGDITIRALETLRSVDRIACEDTRHTGRLLARYEISKPLLSLHAHNEAQRTAELIERIQKDDERVAYVSDAGTPGVSDPGERLVHRCIEAGVNYDILPGPCAVTTALVGSGLGATPFYFGGFLPTKKGQRTTQLQTALVRECTTVFYESPHRIVSTLQLLAELDGERLCCVARELTKRFQDYRR